MKLIHGDCLEKMKDIPDGSIDCVITDPPYGTTACKWDTCIPFEPMWEQLKRVTKKNGAVVLFGSQPFTSALVMSNPKMFKYEWVWEKNTICNFPMIKGSPGKKHENVICFSSGVVTRHLGNPMIYNPQNLIEVNKTVKYLYGGNNAFMPNRKFKVKEGLQKYSNYPTSILKFSVEGKRLHPTQKPVALMEYLIKTYTNEGETVLDFTMGSGTTGVACKNLNRNFIGIELDPEYFEIAKKRINEANRQISLFDDELGRMENKKARNL